jgi:hypothetical protein
MAKLQEIGIEFSAKATIRRTYAGRHQKATGAWTWFLLDPADVARDLGSSYTVTELARAKKITANAMRHGATEIDIE